VKKSYVQYAALAVTVGAAMPAIADDAATTSNGANSVIEVADAAAQAG